MPTYHANIDLPYISVSGGRITEPSVRLETDGRDWRGRWRKGKRGLGFNLARDKWGRADIRVVAHTETDLTLSVDACAEVRRHDWLRLKVDGKRVWLDLRGVDGNDRGLHPLLSAEDADAQRQG